MTARQSRTKVLGVVALFVGLFVGNQPVDAQIFFTSQSSFNSALGSYTLMGSENWSSAGNAVSVNFNDSLRPGIANGPFPNGTTVLSGITVQSNTLANPTVPSPRGTNGLFFAPTGFAGISGATQASNQLSSNSNGDSFDILFATAGAKNPQAVDLSPMYYRTSSSSNTGTLTIRVFNTSNSLLGTTTVANVFDVSETGYIGIVLPSNQFLGRVNISAGSLDVSGADNIRVFGTPVPEPGILGFAGVVVVGSLVRRHWRIAGKMGS